MSVLEIIQNRRSIRKFKSIKIPDKVIIDLINCACLAPSGCNIQSWRYFVLNSTDIRTKLKNSKIFKQEFVYKAPLLIACSANLSLYQNQEYNINHLIESGYLPENIHELIHDEFIGQDMIRATRDVSISATFILLRAYELGLGGCFVGWFNKNKLKDILNITDNYVIPFVLCLEYPDEIPKERKYNELINILKRR